MLKATPLVRLGAAVSLAALASLASAPAAAQSSKDLAQLRQVFLDGRALEDKNDWAGALEKFKEVAAAKMTPQVRFHIALCEEKLGRLVSAKRGFELAAAEGTAAGSAAAEVPPVAKEHADTLAARVAKLHVDVKGRLVSSRILLDGRALSSAELAAEIELDPGAHVLSVRDAGGAPTFHRELSLAEKGEERVEILIADRVEASHEHESGPSRVPAYVTGAVGAAALITSGVFFGLRAGTISTITSHCANMVALTGCRPSDASLASQGRTYTAVADTLVALGAAGVGTGVILFIVLAPKRDPGGRAGAGSSSVWLSPTGSGLRLEGRF
jgi:hypothetical protein